MFEPVNNRVSFPRLEEDIISWWRQNDIFGRSLKERQNGPRFTLFEGPPTANGSPGIHHVLARVFKDVIPRYKSMKGYYTPRIAGWDTHGLPVELEIEKELGFSGKAQIEEYGIAEFNRKCRESVFRYLEQWNEMTERIGYWVDLEHPYVTMKNEYIESVWWALKQMWEKGLIYKGYKTAAHCPRCGTSLSSHEVALGYRDDTEDPSVFIKFAIAPASLDTISDKIKDKPAYLLAWTTTPWTLPGNTALAVAEGAGYSVVEYEGEYLIMATERLAAVGLYGYPVVEEISGQRLVGVCYEPLYNPHRYGADRLRFKQAGSSELVLQPPDDNLTYRVIATDFVSLDDGTGIVHMAPAFGEVDFEAGKWQQLDFVQPVDLQGRLTGNYSFSGKFVKEADPLVIEELQQRGHMFRAETIRHTYPFCWRCQTPLLYYVKESWYIRTTAVKDRLIAGNEEINWYPEHIKYGRFGDWLQNNVDWAFSRERYWGTPLPVWQCEACGRTDCIGGLEELRNKPGIAGMNEPLDMHRPFVDEITFDCPHCGKRMRRVSEVIDCWFDSGAMPVAQSHYPFENETLLEDGRFPADYICEAVDQTRGWFYSLHAISTLLFDRPCYENVICLGLILAADGEKMSKTRGNVVQPGAVIDKYGADALRWYLLTATSPGNVRRFDEKAVAEVSRRFMLTLWNVYSFFVTYANIDNYVPGKESVTEVEPELDRWILSELNQLVVDVDTALGGYNPTEAGRRIENFVDGLSNWYVRRSRRRFWKSESDADKLSAYNTLYECLVTLSKLMAPLAPFVSEAMYRNLVVTAFPDVPESVHLADFPAADEGRIDTPLSEDIRLAMKISSLGRAARSKAGIKVRQPLAEVVVSVTGGREERGLERVKPQILEELNVKDLRVGDGEAVAALDGSGYVVGGLEDGAAGAYLVAVPAKDTISEELLAEGMARELVHRLQTMRRSAGFDIADYIFTSYQGDEYIGRVMAGWAEYIKQETLSRRLEEGQPAEDAYTESFKLSGHEITLGVVKET